MKIGQVEGERCNRPNDDGFACDGEMILGDPVNCYCHISPPCGACLDNQPVCNVCGTEAGDE